MNRIKKLFSTPSKKLIPYLTAGDPDLESTLALMHVMVEEGADLIEVGVPFSDPMADGPVIQRASERALKQQVTLDQVLDLVAAFRKDNQDTPIVLMGYLNPIEQMGYDAFAEKAKVVDLDGVLVVDMPGESAAEFKATLSDNGLDLIMLVAPTTDASRMKAICDIASGYIYYVSVRGVTGSSDLDLAEVKHNIETIKSMNEQDIPVCVGFGIKDAASAQGVANISDGVIIGSAIVKLIETHQPQASDHLGQFIRQIAQAINPT